MEKLEEYVQKSQFSDILRVNFDQKCLQGQKCLLMRSTENVIKYNRGHLSDLEVLRTLQMCSQCRKLLSLCFHSAGHLPSMGRFLWKFSSSMWRSLGNVRRRHCVPFGHGQVHQNGPWSCLQPDYTDWGEGHGSRESPAGMNQAMQAWGE